MCILVLCLDKWALFMCYGFVLTKTVSLPTIAQFLSDKLDLPAPVSLGLFVYFQHLGSKIFGLF